MSGDFGPLSQAMQDAMRGVTWHPEIPSPSLDELRLLAIPFVDFQGLQQHGSLITTAKLAPEVLLIFAQLHTLGFPIQSIKPMVHFDGDDGQSMAANNSSCFNSRFIINSKRLSAHALGAAIDINPVQNPVVRDGKHRPPAGEAYLDRGNERPGMFIPKQAAVQAFLDHGWKWGGDWDNPKDYHHFYKPDAAA